MSEIVEKFQEEIYYIQETKDDVEHQHASIDMMYEEFILGITNGEIKGDDIKKISSMIKIQVIDQDYDKWYS